MHHEQGTLGALLYSKLKPAASETHWTSLVHGAARADAPALHEIYEKAHRPVFTLAMRITGDRDSADEVTLDVFDEVWREAGKYAESEGPVLAWIMRLAHARALEARGAGDLPDTSERDWRLQAAVGALPADECAALEAVFFYGLTCTQAAERLGPEADAVQASVLRGLDRIRRALADGGQWLDAPNDCGQAGPIALHALNALSPDDDRAARVHLGGCGRCRRELASLVSVVAAFVAWPTELLCPPASLRARLAYRMVGRTRGRLVMPKERARPEPAWELVAPKIWCKLLAADTERAMVSMLVRLDPAGEYPPHTHAGREELFLLEGELWIDGRKLHPGDYNRAEAGTGDKRVWSDTGCACVLVTSSRDILG